MTRAGLAIPGLPSGLLAIPLGLAGLLAAAGLNLAHGEAGFALTRLLAALTRGGDEALLRDLLLGFRAPRVAAGVLSGAALAVSGVLMQGVLRNPMVSPGILGISAGGYLAILLASLLAPALLIHAAVPVTVAGGALAVLLVWLVSGGRRATPLRVVLSGLIVGMSLGGIATVLQILFENETRYLLTWGAGRLRQNGWETVRATWWAICGGVLIAAALARQYDLLRLGAEAAQGLGLDQRRVVILSLGLVLVMTGAAVALTGPIGFVGLVVPHLLRLAGVRRHAALIPAAGLWGGALLLGADTLTYRMGGLTSAPPVGAITAALGAPLLLWLVLRGGVLRRGGMLQPAPFGLPRIAGLSTGGVIVLLTAALLVAAGLALTCVGGLAIAPGDLLAALSGNGAPVHQQILWQMRLPRAVLAALTGAGMALAGALMQGVLRNPLADAGMLGISAGATAAILGLLAFIPLAGGLAIAGAALAGGLGAGAAVYLLAWRHPTPMVLILTGIAVSALCGAVVQILVMQNLYSDSPLLWLVGGLHARGWAAVAVILPVLAGVTLAALAIARRLDLLALGDLTATGLGVRVRPLRILGGALAILLAAVLVAQVGPIGYIGLLAPHMARLCTSGRLAGLLPVAMLAGALMLLLADWLARIVLAPTELPAGAIVALVGAPYLILLISRSTRT